MNRPRFTIQVAKDLKLWFLIVGLMGATRLAIMLAFHGRWDDTTGTGELLTACLRGLRFDAQFATLWCLVPLLTSIVCGWHDLVSLSDRLRRWWLALFILIAVPATAVDIGYFLEYHQQFDHFLFGAVYDDQGAIVDTIWATYHPLRYLFGSVIAGIAIWWLGRRWIASPLIPTSFIERLPPALRVVLVLVMAALIVASARGSFARRPLQLKDSAVVADRLLNAWVPTPFHAFGHALQTWRDMRSMNGITAFIPDGNVARAAAEVFPAVGVSASVDEYLRRTAPGYGTPPGTCTC